MQAYPFIREVRDDSHKFLCTICGRQLACGHQGKYDVERHVGKGLHQANAKNLNFQSTLAFHSKSKSSLQWIIIIFLGYMR